MGLLADGANEHSKHVGAIINIWPSIHSMVHECLSMTDEGDNELQNVYKQTKCF
jgi:hypothetical protein